MQHDPIDWHRVAELREDVGAEDFGDVATLFLQEVEETLAAMRGRPDALLLAERLHFLKGAALNLGFSALAEMCQQGEAEAGNGAPVDLEEIAAAFERARAAFLAGLRG